MFTRIDKRTSIPTSSIMKVSLNKFELIDQEGQPLKAHLNITIETRDMMFGRSYTCINEILSILEKFNYNKEINQIEKAMAIRHQKIYDLVIQKS